MSATPYSHTVGVFHDHDHGDPETGGHTTDGGRVHGVTQARYVECERYACPTVVVLNPEDREQAKALVARFFGMKSASEVDADAMQAALRALANPQPPKPDEPTLLGALVEDEDGFVWVRQCTTDGETDMSHPWLLFSTSRVPMPATQHERSWSAMHVSEVLYDGYERKATP